MTDMLLVISYPCKYKHTWISAKNKWSFHNSWLQLQLFVNYYVYLAQFYKSTERVTAAVVNGLMYPLPEILFHKTTPKAKNIFFCHLLKGHLQVAD